MKGECTLGHQRQRLLVLSLPLLSSELGLGLSSAALPFCTALRCRRELAPHQLLLLLGFAALALLVLLSLQQANRGPCQRWSGSFHFPNN